MKALINETISELSNVTVRENPKRGTPCNLFFEENSPQIDFNGFKCPTEYETHCNGIFNNIKQNIDMTDIHPVEKVIHLKDLKFEVSDFKKRLFPDDDLVFIFERIKHVKQKAISSYSSDSFKNKIIVYINIQQRLLVRIEQYLTYLIQKLQIRPINTYKALPPLFQEAYDESKLESRGFSKLRVFNKYTGTTILSFNGTKSDFEVFIDVLQRAKMLIHPDGKSATKPELRELFSFIGNFEPAKNPASTLNDSKERLEKSNHIFIRLTAAYQDLKQEDYRPDMKKM